MKEQPSVITSRSIPKSRRALIGLTTEQLREKSVELGFEPFRGKQLAEWLYQKRARTFDAMTNLPAAFRDALSANHTIGWPEVVSTYSADDGTAKFLVEYADGNRVECVLLPYEDRAGVCLSSQVGCAAGCVFCATGAMGFTRNLTPGEMVAQALVAEDRLVTQSSSATTRLSHVVFMGMGEPLWNLENVIQAVYLLNEEMKIGMRGITVSTVGIPPAMRTLAEEKLQITLAVSLHAGTEEVRRQLVPVARKYPMESVFAAADRYFDLTGRRVTYEYVLLGGVNDTKEEATALAAWLRGRPAHVNLIPWNPARSISEFKAPHREAVARFRNVLESVQIPVTQRFERGRGIDAACGQLAIGKRRR